MAKTAKFTEQMPFVGTPDQFRLMGEVEKRINDSKAAVIRAGLNVLFDLVDDVLPEGADEATRVETALRIVRRTEDFVVVRRADLPPGFLSDETSDTPVLA